MSGSSDWLRRYSESHQHPVNRACHAVGIPMIVLSIILGIATIGFHALWPVALALFVLGWVLQFIGHAVEGKQPAFFSDWRFLLAGVKWWFVKMRGGGRH
jgi:uncharacterized membrane protein YGL010W